jgi:hypothetical protein
MLPQQMLLPAVIAQGSSRRHNLLQSYLYELCHTDEAVIARNSQQQQQETGSGVCSNAADSARGFLNTYPNCGCSL